nr:probable signal peptidase complex subunit 2 [Ipomoea batatas]
MQEKMGDAGCKGKKVKKTNLLDQHSIKHLLDESVSEIVTSRGYAEDFAMSNIRLLLGTVVIAIALFAQFYNKKFPENRNILIGSFSSTGLVVSSKLPRFSDMYTLMIASADPQSISAKPPVYEGWSSRRGTLLERCRNAH